MKICKSNNFSNSLQENEYEGERYLKVDKVLKILSISRSYLRKIEIDEELIPVRKGTKWVRYVEREVKDYITKQMMDRQKPSYIVDDVEYDSDDAYELNMICSEIPGMN